ncbi:MAG: dienelactone hydrolase family protein [Rhodobacteraceae bacterium]|nr:dienelactone hydrolase family protein [Paracoccaceae bacterium]
MSDRLLAANGQAALLLIHPWWGLSAGTRALGERFRAAGITVMLADLFAGRIAGNEQEARALRATKRAQPMYRDLLDDIATLKAATGAARVGVLGLSMGGHWAIWLAQNAPAEVAACITYYAARGGNFAAADCAFQAHFAGTDPFVSMGARRGMLAAIRKTDCPVEVFDYPATSHWFAESDRPEYDSDATQAAFERSLFCLTAASA